MGMRGTVRLPIYTPEEIAADLAKSQRLPDAPLARMTRQLLRNTGHNEIKRRLRAMFPKYNRKEISQLAMKLHNIAWKSRDYDAIQQYMRQA
jgi:hypothetical protein